MTFEDISVHSIHKHMNEKREWQIFLLDSNKAKKTVIFQTPVTPKRKTQILHYIEPTKSRDKPWLNTKYFRKPVLFSRCLYVMDTTVSK